MNATRQKPKQDRNTVPQEMFILELQVGKPTSTFPEGKWQGVALATSEHELWQTYHNTPDGWQKRDRQGSLRFVVEFDVRVRRCREKARRAR